jgi:GNAT superfamily N-acetyltransferase
MPLATTPRLVVRPVSADDEARLERLGPQARTLRLNGRVTLAAVDPSDGSFAGVAQYAPGGDGTSDVTFAVADEWQRRGVGAMLALALLRRASADRRRRLAAVLRPRSRRPALAI